MTKTELSISQEIKKKNGILFYRICSREIIVCQYKALDAAYLKDKIYFKHDLIRLTRRKNKTVIVKKNPCTKAINSAMDMFNKGIYSFIDSNNMSKTEMIIFLKFNPYIKVSHWLFDVHEYIVNNEKGYISDENGYIFEDWYSNGPGMHNGIRMRNSDNWLTGWYVKKDDML